MNISASLVTAFFAICVSAHAQTASPDSIPIPVYPAHGHAQVPEANLPRVLLIGDSIEGGYAPFVQQALKSRAVVVPVQRKLRDGSTIDGMKEMDAWLAKEHWAVIHFNWGMWDLKVVGKNADNNVLIEQYASNLRVLIAKMKKSGASLIFATTTPVPENVLDTDRRPADALLYNAVALKIMQETQIHVDDLYTLVYPRLAEFQSPSNVHFSDEGYQFMGKKVAASIEFMLRLRASQSPGSK